MKYPIIFLTLMSLIYVTACNRTADKPVVSELPADSTKFRMFAVACENQRSLPNYVVVTVKNMNSEEVHEICTEIQILNDAVNLENGTDTELDCSKYKERYFEFSKDSALSTVNFTLYSSSDLEKYAKTLNIADIVASVKSGKVTGKTFDSYGKEQIMFAHLMFNNGVMMTRGRIIANICGLSWYRD
jgi:hypothetical protein